MTEMSAAAASEDGSLPDARRQLDDAISGLCDPKPQTLHDGTLTWLDSAYCQLRDAVPGSKRERTGVSGSQPPVWIDALELCHEIDTAVSAWEPRWPSIPGDLTGDPPPVTILRLRAIQARGWRPQDCRSILQIAEAVQSWADGITDLLSDLPRMSLWGKGSDGRSEAAACPACGTKTVYRNDSGGELVRQPALQITTLGCQCQRCRFIWGPERFRLLAEVLGCPLPEGCLE